MKKKTSNVRIPARVNRKVVGKKQVELREINTNAKEIKAGGWR